MAFDLNWSNVRLLMSCDDFVNARSGDAGTFVGTPVIDNAVKQFGSGSLHCSTGNYVQFDDSSGWDLSYDDFAIELWVKFDSDNTNQKLIGQYGSGAYWGLETDDYGYLVFKYYNGSTLYSVQCPQILTANVWHQITVSRYSAYVRIYLDGLQTQYTYYSNNISGSSNPLSIGYDVTSAYFDEIRITAHTARSYYNSTLTLQDAPFPNTDHNIYEDELIEGVLVTDAATANATQNLVLIDETLQIALQINTTEDGRIIETLSVADAAKWAQGATVIENLTGTEILTSPLITALSDSARVVDSIQVSQRFSVALAETVTVVEKLTAGIPITIEEGATADWVLSVVQGVTITEKLGFSEVWAYPAIYGQTIAEQAVLLDDLRRFLHAEVIEGITVGETVTAIARISARIDELIEGSDEAIAQAIFNVTATDDGILSDDFSLSMIFRPEIVENLTITGLLAIPGQGLTTWTVNTRTGAVTEYENFAFNSFAQSGVHYLGATEDGLYALDGDDDAGTSIISHLKSGYAQFGGSRFTSFKAAYLGMRGEGEFFLKLETGDGKTYTYKSVIQNQETTKVRLGKGLRARYFAFELITTGQDFDLDNIEFIPLIANRRV